jgi:hypothetical protein
VAAAAAAATDERPEGQGPRESAAAAADDDDDERRGARGLGFAPGLRITTGGKEAAGDARAALIAHARTRAGDSVLSWPLRAGVGR